MSRLYTVISDGRSRLALGVGKSLMDFQLLADSYRKEKPSAPASVDNMPELLRNWGEWEGRITELERHGQQVRAQEGLLLQGAKLQAPLARPPKILCIAFNNRLSERFQDRFDKTGNPSWFMKAPTCVVGPDEEVELTPPGWSNVITPEAELGIIIGRRVRWIDRKDVYSVVAGYTLLNDVTAQDLLIGEPATISPERYFVRKILPDPGQPWEKDQLSGPNRIEMKQWDTFAPLGPCLVTKDEIQDPHRMSYFCRINGELIMEGPSLELIWDVPELIHQFSLMMTLEPGDVLSTGNVGRLSPKAVLKPGDVMEIGMSGIGVLRNPCVRSKYPAYQKSGS